VREVILEEIRRLAAARGGKAPGRETFERQTGIRQTAWSGVYWARWGEALAEAGFEPNSLQGKLDERLFFTKLTQAIRHYGRIPTGTELRLYRREVDPSFPSHSTVANRGAKAALLDRLASWVDASGSYADVSAILAGRTVIEVAKAQATSIEGFVYLIKSGTHYKIGRSDEIERRVKEIRVALPEAANLVHVIRTDDPAGIEAYWHQRFADRRANGEWFKLTPADLSAFKRRKYQ
jgi:hypothetical protein